MIWNNLLKIGLIIVAIIFRHFLFSVPELLYWWYKDLRNFDRDVFRPYGVWMYTGKQGSGKTMSLIYKLEQLRRRYPKIKIYTNCGYKFQTGPLLSLNDLLDKSKYNGEFGTVFVIDEIQNEFSCATSKDFPETLLSLITMQRKQRVLILTTSQVFSRVSKPIREQCYRAIECFTFLGRYTVNRFYDGIKYADSFELSPDERKKACRKLYKIGFVQTDYLRNCFNSYEIIGKLSRVGFAPKSVFNESNTYNKIVINKKK